MFKQLTAVMTLAAGIALAADVKAADEAPEMRVDEPKLPSIPPIDPSTAVAGWQAGDAKALSASDRAIIEERRQAVKEMTERIREKREALEQSAGEEKRIRSQELKELIFDGDKDLNKKEEQSEKQIQKKEEIREKQAEKVNEKASQKDKHEKDPPGNPGKGPKKNGH